MEDRFEKGMSVLKITNEKNIEDLFKELEDIAPDLSRFIVEFGFMNEFCAKLIKTLCSYEVFTENNVSLQHQ